MKEHPIIFNGDMVRAILDGRKTQTRRPVKFMKRPPPASKDPRNYGEFVTTQDTWCFDSPGVYARCPFGIVGDRLWVRETWSADFRTIFYFADREDRYFQTEHEKEMIRLYDSQRGPKRPSIHMPRWASRITLEVCVINAERLHAITEDEARAEGVEYVPSMDAWYDYGNPENVVGTARESFLTLWHSLYPDDYGQNPWVWMVGFRKLEGVSTP